MVKLHIILNPNTSKEQALLGLLQYCSDKSKVKLQWREEIDKETEEHNFTLEFNSLEDCKLFLFDFFNALNVPDHDFVEITKSDLSIIAYDQDLINFITLQFQRSTQYDIDLLDMICSDLAYSQTKNEERLDSIDNYLKSSGIMYYQQFMKELITVLDAKELLDKDSILKKMFETIH